MYISRDLPLYAEGGLEAAKLYASSRDSILSRTEPKPGEPILPSRLALMVRVLIFSADGLPLVSLSDLGDSSMRCGDDFLFPVRCSELDLEVTFENPEGYRAVRITGGSAASSSGLSSDASWAGCETSVKVCVRLEGCIEKVFEPLELGREALGVRGLLEMRGGPTGDGKLSPDITSKESRRSDMTSGFAGLTRTSLGPLRGEAVGGPPLEKLGPNEGGAASSLEGRADIVTIFPDRRSYINWSKKCRRDDVARPDIVMLSLPQCLLICRCETIGLDQGCLDLS